MPQNSFNQHWTYLIHKLVMIMDKLAVHEMQKSLPFSYSQFLVLMAIDHIDSASQTKVAKYINTTQAAVSRQIEHLHQSGLLKRSEDIHNRRQNILQLTAVGKRDLDRAYKIIRVKSDQLFETLNESEQVVFISCLCKLLGALEDTNPGKYNTLC